MNHFQVKSILSILLILATCTMLHVNCSGVNGSNDLKLRLFGIRQKPSKKEQIIMSLIQENRRELNRMFERQRKREQDKMRRVEEKRRLIFMTYLGSRVSGSFLNDFTSSGRFFGRGRWAASLRNDFILIKTIYAGLALKIRQFNVSLF